MSKARIKVKGRHRRNKIISLTYDKKVLQTRTFTSQREVESVLHDWVKMYALKRPKQFPVFITQGYVRESAKVKNSIVKAA